MCETKMGQQVAQLHIKWMMMIKFIQYFLKQTQMLYKHNKINLLHIMCD